MNKLHLKKLFLFTLFLVSCDSFSSELNYREIKNKCSLENKNKESVSDTRCVSEAINSIDKELNSIFKKINTAIRNKHSEQIGNQFIESYNYWNNYKELTCDTYALTTNVNYVDCILKFNLAKLNELNNHYKRLN